MSRASVRRLVLALSAQCSVGLSRRRNRIGGRRMTRSPPPKQPRSARAIAPHSADIVTANELRSKTFPPVKYVVPGIIPEGVTLLVAKPKEGKSWLALDLCIACTTDRFTLGSIKPTQGDVLYLALEDSERRLHRRMDKLLPAFGGAWPKDRKSV